MSAHCETLEDYFSINCFLNVYRCLEAKLLRRIFSFIDPEFSQPQTSTIFNVCKYWRNILTHKSLVRAGKKKPAAKQMVIGTPKTAQKAKRSKFHDMLRLDSFKGMHNKQISVSCIFLSDAQEMHAVLIYTNF